MNMRVVNEYAESAFLMPVHKVLQRDINGSWHCVSV